MVKLALARADSLSALARRFHVSRKTAHKWCARFLQGGVGPRGNVRWLGRIRLLSRTLAHQRVGLRTVSPDLAEVYLDHIHVGNLHRHDLAGMRPIILISPSHPPKV